MIGQDAMVTTLKNAFETGRIAHAFMLTGVRGIGKTTTARLLARALNYETDEVDHPSVNLSEPGRHCEAIMNSTHMDVLEMDAASRTGVDNMRELLDGVRYAPADARYKVYIIDEVHMLSAGAFNALLSDMVVFGELSLSGDVRPVSRSDARLKEAHKLGFERALAAPSPKRRAADGTVRNDNNALPVIAIKSLRDLVRKVEASVETGPDNAKSWAA